MWEGRRFFEGGDYSRDGYYSESDLFFCLMLPNLYCVVPKNIHTPLPLHGGHFCFRVRTCTTRGCLTYPLRHPLEFLKFSNLVGYPPGKIFPSKMPLQNTFMRKIIVSAIKRGKIFLLMLIQCQIISIFPCSVLS